MYFGSIFKLKVLLDKAIIFLLSCSLGMFLDVNQFKPSLDKK